MTLYLSEYKTFDSVQELNHHVDQWRNLTTATEFRVLWFVSNYAVKYPGAAHLKAATIAVGINVSTKTVYRALKSLAELGAIVKHVTTRPVSGGQGANIYTVQPCMSSRQEDAEPCESKPEASKTEKETASSIKLKKVLKNTYGASPCRPFYRRFKEFIASTIGGDQALVSRLFGVYKAHSTPMTKYGAFEEADVEHAGYEALRASVMACKTKRIRNIAGYYSSVFDRILDLLVIKKTRELLLEQ
ncbi:hypothetical protein BTO30_02900 [Domibacillus antri]|uniref:Uncharacterized protein n=1 Tax=Domibacillus antri TaxID=1714264 RepID=A0A1Q8Q8S1_9BACI|nr:HTH domain-containing protein [Domibacillus antri]OLN23701.1 hypothetical protein BTO30_02900 [Domibacillus antri]